MEGDLNFVNATKSGSDKRDACRDVGRVMCRLWAEEGPPTGVHDSSAALSALREETEVQPKLVSGHCEERSCRIPRRIVTPSIGDVTVSFPIMTLQIGTCH